jgi:hypothetical protein
LPFLGSAALGLRAIACLVCTKWGKEKKCYCRLSEINVEFTKKKKAGIIVVQIYKM